MVKIGEEAILRAVELCEELHEEMEVLRDLLLGIENYDEAMAVKRVLLTADELMESLYDINDSMEDEGGVL